jgi:hypothetical protein
MKAFVLCFLVLCSCRNNATILSNDGTGVLAFCEGDAWIDCVAQACPNGYVVVQHAPCKYGCDALIKCNP